jgi:hypothetical protein
MKTELTAITIAAVLLAGCITPCAAADPGVPRAVGRQVHQDISKWDLNKNGSLDGKEMEAFRKDALRERHVQFAAIAKAAAEVRRQETIAHTNRFIPPALRKQYDSNGDGLLDSAEYQKYRQDLQKRKAERAGTAAAAPPPPAK